ncbi:carbonic anhydrase 15 [Drosophila simulans]|uniref:Carbonic anhydrase n=1 Tax=Drosophila simulans TaxID=7240 RepID=B4R004_DROSI|nr:carbonic anhydrase 15 [Drosophila simulans]XP_039151328.1 carbonic anhydrase 15 [Drosophila simulans]XP_039151329.1 carbonic anhydrase 15 [Drosophila simulans]XP_039151330.1 carbonic anhydrase 15 [Drosophila simulans]XP_039151331.1 carbonic anhydrase 15 [Drosophila simulans]XP_039151332.1 carbonic anhydrase 15 [Drosophila simulans]XP_039151333.1 carbonic anhydrase 15 [Drosophila simulans]XP_039151334.1 carbonic anhydrase 15 [Drosophila simulans]XP_039151335.1 carbonic anhydrase 15 [Droso
MHLPALDDFYQRLLFLLPFAANFRSTDFDYKSPERWPEKYPNCGGSEQSPIAISRRKAIALNLPPLVFALYDEFFDELVTVRNSGHTVEFKVPTTIYGLRPYVTGGLLRDCYDAEAVHFHWGSPESKGSEHLLNGRRFDLEMHIVHRNTKYLNFEEAVKYSDGVTVLAVLFKVVRSGPFFYQPGLSEIFGSLLHLGNFNASYTVQERLTLGSLLGSLDRGNFYTYKGSLTTPPCSPVVQWHVFGEVLPISHQDLPKFWNLRDERGRPLLKNFRPLQSQENRLIFHRQHIVPLQQEHLQELIWL